jgi:cardiolipin synthase
VMDRVAGAQRDITVISAYLTFPMTDALAAAQARGVAVRLITPRDNNKALVRDYLLATAAGAGFEVRLLPGMSHLKGMLIDDAHLIIGSSNFDFVSLGAEEELVAIVSDSGLIADFKRQIIGPALAEALPPGSYEPAAGAGQRAHNLLRFVDAVVGLTRNVKRGAYDYPV